MYWFPERGLALLKEMKADYGYFDEPIKQFNIQCRKYLGFGYLLSFIPGREAYKARQYAGQQIETTLSEKRSQLESQENVPFFKSLRLRNAYYSLPLWSVFEGASEFVDADKIKHNKETVMEVLGKFPLLGNLFSGRFEKTFYNFLNPVSLVRESMEFGQAFINRFFEIGAGEEGNSNRFRLGAKAFFSGLFFLAALPVNAVEQLIDSVESRAWKMARFTGVSIAETLGCKQTLDKYKEPQSDPSSYVSSPVQSAALNKVGGTRGGHQGYGTTADPEFELESEYDATAAPVSEPFLTKDPGTRGPAPGGY